MKIRKRILPRVASDLGAFLFVLFIIPVTYYFELFIVLPALHSVWSFWYTLHFICATYVMVNVTSNFVAVVVVDTSLQNIVTASSQLENWRYCTECETVAPPRSWHCDTCKTCILKRDHHCMFTGCCVGHYNYRYFYMFLLYVFIGTFYSTYLNCFYIWKNFEHFSLLGITKFIFPMAMLVLGVDATEKQVCLLIFIINFVGAIFTLVLLVHHTSLVCKGMVTHEKSKNITYYDSGLKKNLSQTFGKRWHVSWLFPFVASELPNDGTDWNDLQKTD
ncbi:probable palmitoyltransferase ZDHHC24 [Schistocerca cancellata]|uniref:probable palmitoyltransferase ZDHHC24 n=1 Tax=Schistocerca cancellata TaxID=274614 RepID=UPI0021196878|nr:probable palmitoyltransferase ZDHHC24 [Schistocerca cancellata]